MTPPAYEILCADVSEYPACSILIGRIPAYTTYEDGADRMSRNVGTYNSDAGESPKINNTTFRTCRKFEIKNNTVKFVCFQLLPSVKSFRTWAIRMLDGCCAQDSSPHGDVPGLGTHHVSRTLFFAFSFCVFQFNERQKASKEPNDLTARLRSYFQNYFVAYQCIHILYQCHKSNR